MAKKKVRKQKSTVAQHYTSHGAALGLPQAMVDAFMALYNARKLPQAQQAAQHMIERYPQSAFSWKALGTSYLEAENPSEALSPLLKSVEIDSNDFLALTSLAAAFYQTGSSEQAIKYQKQAVNLQEKYAPARYRLAEMLKESGLHKEALMHAEEAKVLGIDSLRVEVLIGTIKYQLRQFSESLLIFEKLEKEYPENFVIYNNLGNINKDLGRHEKAEAYYKKSLAVQPDNWMAYSNLFFAKHYNVNSTTSEILELGRSWEKKFSLPRLGLHKNSKEPLKKLSIGLVSSGFRLHPVGQMIASALENSRSDIDFYAYTTNDNNDFVTEKIKNSCKQWSAIRSLTQKQIAQKIYDDNIDILIDLSGHGDGSCLQAISMRPAPLCVKWVGGLVNTMGLESIDYLLSDHIETPQGVDNQYTEKLIRLPDDYICYMPCAYAPSTSSLPAIKNNFITLGCLNNPAKISGQLLNEWARLMHQIPDSRLLLRGGQYESEDFCCWLWDEMTSHGIERERVILEGPTDHKNFIGTYQRIDIALDTWPYSGGLTTCEALLMGVPVVTLPGPTFAGRHSATHLINAGLPELVTNSWDEYRQRVVELTNDLPNLAVIRAGLRTILHYSPVCDAPRFANHFNNALRAIWVRYCEDKAPEALTFNKEGEMWFADEDKLVELLPVVSMEEAGKDQDQAFEWKLDEPIIIVDNAAVLPRHPEYPKWMASGHLAVISFDPASVLNKKIDELKEYGELHHYPHALLGDGQPATFYATLDAEKGSTLKPLPEEQLPEYERDKLKILAKLPINTVSLDSIEGLQSVDMLVLDDLHDAIKILENGREKLKSTLLIQVKVAFQPTHERQPNLAELQHWASRNGFRFYTFNNIEYKKFSGTSGAALNASELFCVSVILFPVEERIKALSVKKAMSLACLLDNLYQFDDAVSGVLELSQNFKTLTNYSKRLPSNSRMGGKESFRNIEKLSNLAEAEALLEMIKNIKKNNVVRIEEIIATCEKSLKQDASNNVAFFVLTHALLLRSTKNNDADLLSSELRKVGWEEKYSLYSYWLESHFLVKEIVSPACSAVVIANKFKNEIVENIKELRRQGGDSLEIVFVNNGADSNNFLAIKEYVNIWVNVNGNSGAYLARNLGFIFSNSPLVLFVDDDGFPEEGFVSSHIKGHANSDLACLRGACKCYSGNAPSHYSLGNKRKIAPPTLEGNVSFSKSSFSKVGGWGDYILFGHGGFDISIRLFEVGFKAEHQQYSPKAILRHEYTQGNIQASEKFKKQNVSGLLLEALHGGAGKKLKQYFSADSGVFSENIESEDSYKNPIVPENSFPSEVAELVINTYSSANTILEYGTGGSTIIAANMTGKTVYGVENDREWAANMSRVIEKENFANKPLIHYVDIGETGKWAKPLNKDKWKSYPSYATSIWKHEEFQDPDVVLIDGRLRTSCLLWVLKKAKKKTTVLFDDYKERPYYHVVERLIKPEKIVGRMAVFYVDPSKEYMREEDNEWVEAEFYKVTMAGSDSR
jgi:predicted O-linked N-acetylglucosamine transferase (SPINDLY family)/glycosyltransferase involved in cell wall biosynthesis